MTIIWIGFDQQINAPQRVLEAMQQQLIKLVQQGQMSDVIYMTIQKHVIEMGGIKRAAIVFIARHCHFLTQHYCIGRYILFCWALPFGLQAVMGFGHRYWLGLFLIYCLGWDELARQLEEPLALTIMIWHLI